MNKIGFLFTTVIMMLLLFVFSASATNNEFAGGSGTEDAPYLIATKEHLDNVRNYPKAHYKMISDIFFTMSDFSSQGEFYNSGKGWEPIGSSDVPFSGFFDGNGHTIKGLYINVTSSRVVYAGLFGCNEGTIQNLGIINCNITAKNTDSSAAFAGSIAGSGGRIINCYNTGNIIACSPYIAYAGGIVGSGSNIENCYNTGNISAISSSSNYSATYCEAYAGGIVGRGGYISECYNTGTITASAQSLYYNVPTKTNTGGVAGHGWDVLNSFNTGSISSSTSSEANTGGICGLSEAITNCYNVGNLTSTSTSISMYTTLYTGEIAGNLYSGIITNCYYLDSTNKGIGFGADFCTKCTSCDMLKQSTYIEFDFDKIWEINKNVPYQLPILKETNEEIILPNSIKIGHTISDWIVDKQATCTQEGEKHKECQKCTEILESGKILKTAHSFTQKIIDSKHLVSTATTSNPAIYKYDCAKCNAISDTMTFKHGNALILGKTSKITATQTANSIKLTWSAVAGAEKYNVYREISGNWKLIGNTTKLEYSFNNLSAGAKYSFAVRAMCTVNGKSTLAPTYATFDTATKTVKPSNVTATQSTSSITLIWPKCAGAMGYRIFVKSGSSWNVLVSATTATSYTVKSLKAGTKYTYAVRPYVQTNSGVVWSDYTECATATKAVKPSKVTAKQTANTITLNWTKCSGATGYRIYYKSGSAWKVAVSSTAATTHTFKNLKAGAKYTFAVRPYIKNGSTVIWSDYTTYTAATNPATVTVKASSPSKGKISLSWNAVNGADGYQVYYKTGNGSYKLYKTVGSGTKSLSFSNLKSGTKYTFAVRAGIKTSGGNIFGGYKAATVTVK